MQTTIRGPIAGTEAARVAEEALRACVHCGFCNATCPTYQLTGDELDGPRGRIYLMKQALEGEPVSEISLNHLDRCLSCRSCETTCPSGVQYHRLYDVGHQLVAEAAPRGWGGRLLRWAIRRATTSALFGLALRVGRWLRPLLPQALRAKVTPRIEPGPWPKARHARRVLMLGGCVQASAAPHFNAAAARVLDRGGVESLEIAGCCGAVHFHLDAPEAARAAARRNLDAWRPHLESGAQEIVITSSGCATFVRDYPDVLRDDPDYLELARAAAALVRDPVEAISAAALPIRRAPAEPRIAVHEPCTLQHGLRLTGRIAELLRGLGYDPQPVADNHLCCGSAGAYSLLHPEMAGELKRAKLQALNAASPAAIYTANIGCWMHLADGSPAPVRHWIEAVDDVTRP
ncbi:MAG: glycolate oxidase subunit GlcF [Phenylobacterium sp.]|uniref:glycolate oxidase subunit GlcF n=1 Tax=Phenylobacterium sp. TaxID=1871053 RepID=UPI00391A9700